MGKKSDKIHTKKLETIDHSETKKREYKRKRTNITMGLNNSSKDKKKLNLTELRD